MRPAYTMKPRALSFGVIADVLFQIIINGELDMVLTLCLLNKATYETIKLLEPHICTWFMRINNIKTFDPILTLNPYTGNQHELTVHTLPKFLYRKELGHHLALHIIPSVWGPFFTDDKAEMDLQSPLLLKLVKRLERGLYVLFHMADISRDMERQGPQMASSTSLFTKRLGIFAKMLDEYREYPIDKQNLMSFDQHTKHVYTVLKWGRGEAEIGKKRRQFRRHLDDQTEIDFHCTIRMVRQLLERMLLRHGPRYWHRDTRNEYSVIWWFLLKQPPRTLAKLLLSPQDECCHLDGRFADSGLERCRFSNPLDDYWQAWEDVPELQCHDCDCKQRVRSWSVKPALMDAKGREFNRTAERYLREVWSESHAGLPQTFTMGIFATVLDRVQELEIP